MRNDASDLEFFCKYINSLMGFAFTPEKKYLIFSRLEKRLDELGAKSYKEYQKILENEPGEIDLLYNMLTTNVTSFFRESKQLDMIKLIVQNVCNKFENKKTIRCWSAGCSSGEEAYTLAMIFDESLRKGWDYKILASDINSEKLQEGMKGVYSLQRILDVPKHLRLKYFRYHQDKDLYEINPGIRNKIVFRKINLNDNFFIPSHIGFDFIFCRNVFIYFGASTRKKVINHFHHLLNDGGYLVFGACENLNISSDSRWKLIKSSIYQKIKQPPAVSENLLLGSHF